MSFFCVHLKRAREAAGLSKKELAERLQISLVSYSHYESGRREPKADMILQVCQALGLSPDKLLAPTPAARDQVAQDAAFSDTAHYQASLQSPPIIGDNLITVEEIAKEIGGDKPRATLMVRYLNEKISAPWQNKTFRSAYRRACFLAPRDEGVAFRTDGGKLLLKPTPYADISTTVSQYLFFFRISHGLGVIDFAHAVNIHPNMISNYENGKAVPSLDALIKMASYFHVDVNVFLRGGFDITTLQNRLIYARAIPRDSYREFSKRIDVSGQFISEIEKGYAPPSINILEKIADISGLSLSFFIF